MIGIGLIFGFVLLDLRIKKNAVDYKTDLRIYISLIFSILAGFLGSKIFEMIYKRYPFTLSGFINSGSTFYGGLIFGLITFLVFCSLFKLNYLMCFNLAAPSLILAHAFGRLGCFFGGCCFGKPTSTVLGIRFPVSSIPYEHYGETIGIFPVQLYESFFLLMLFFVLVKFVPFNFSAAAYLVSYGIFRYLIEYLRGDERGILFSSVFSPSQLISMGIFILGILFFINERRKKVF
jgi:phosphatidylglycerol:prolipoprotein diacylglycerol transferase